MLSSTKNSVTTRTIRTRSDRTGHPSSRILVGLTQRTDGSRSCDPRTYKGGTKMVQGNSSGIKAIALLLMWGILLAAGTVPVTAQTCNLSSRQGAANTEFDTIFTEDGPGTGLE